MKLLTRHFWKRPIHGESNTSAFLAGDWEGQIASFMSCYTSKIQLDIPGRIPGSTVALLLGLSTNSC